MNKRLEYQRQWRKDNPDKVYEYDKTKRLKHKDKINARRRKNWQLKGKWLKEKERRKQPEIKKKYIESLSRYYEKHPELNGGRWALQSWSRFIKSRDKLCQNCGGLGEISHHLLFKSLYPKLMLNRNNGITLCKSCHSELHYGRKEMESEK